MVGDPRELGERVVVGGDLRRVGEIRARHHDGIVDPAKRKKVKRRVGKHEAESAEPGGDVGAICRDRCFANGLVMRSVVESMVLSPPLVITRDEVDEVVEKARRSLDETLGALARGGVQTAGAPAGAHG